MKKTITETHDTNHMTLMRRVIRINAIFDIMFQKSISRIIIYNVRVYLITNGTLYCD